MDWRFNGGLARRPSAGGVGSVSRRKQAKRRSAPRNAVDIQPTAERQQTFTDAEQSPSDLADFRPQLEFRRVEAKSLIGHGNAERIIRTEGEIHGDAIDAGVLHNIEQELANGSKEQRSYIFPVGVGLRVSRDVDLESVL